MTGLTFTATGQTFTLAYDDNGNLLSRTQSGNPANTITPLAHAVVMVYNTTALR